MSSESSGVKTLPPDCETLLAMVSPARRAIYELVRKILDEMEAAAPWESLYYPPDDAVAFLEMEIAFLRVVEGIPAQVKVFTDRFSTVDAEDQQVIDDARFFFPGIHDGVSGDLTKLRSKIRAFSVTAESIALTSDERAFTCEITADLKGKYSSSIMGAAASLIAEGTWGGVEIEPILFPEKAEEFERNALLMETLTEVVDNITHLLEELPLAEVVRQWEARERVDQYALTALYSFLGNLGKLMKGKCRRALYSGDYHQIQKREGLLSLRINELTSLHNSSWGTGADPYRQDSEIPYEAMIQKATELAAILDVNILRKIIGERYVKDILTIVTLERERENDEVEEGAKPWQSSLRQHLPKHLHSLIPLLYDEDLQNYLSLLLGSVFKRASLVLQRRKEQEAAEQQLEELFESDPNATPVFDLGVDENAPDFDPDESFAETSEPWDEGEAVVPEEPEIDFSPLEAAENALSGELTFEPEPESTAMPEPEVELGHLSEIDGVLESDLEVEFTSDLGSEPVPIPEPEPVPDGPSNDEKLVALRNLEEILQSVLSRSNSHRKSFELVHRLLKLGKTVPPAMLESMHPYLYDLMNLLIPHLHNLPEIDEVPSDLGAQLIEHCTFLCNKDLGPEQLRKQVPDTMARLMRMLDALSATSGNLIRQLAR